MMSQWFDIWSVENPSEKEEVQIKGLRESMVEILEIIRIETLLLPSERIILGGISQGGATAILALLYGDIKLGGFLGFSSWLPFKDKITAIAIKFTGTDVLPHVRCIISEATTEPKCPQDLQNLSAERAIRTPIFLSHSEDDNVVPIDHGECLFGTLHRLGFAVVWKTYGDGGHWINEPHGVDDIVAFLHDNVVISF